MKYILNYILTISQTYKRKNLRVLDSLIDYTSILDNIIVITSMQVTF